MLKKSLMVILISLTCLSQFSAPVYASQNVSMQTGFIPSEDEETDDEEPEDRDSENQRPEEQDPNHERPENRDPNNQEPKEQDPDHERPEDRDPNNQGPKEQDPNHERPENRSPENQDPGDQKPENQDPEDQDPENQDPDNFDKPSYDDPDKDEFVSGPDSELGDSDLDIDDHNDQRDENSEDSGLSDTTIIIIAILVGIVIVLIAIILAMIFLKKKEKESQSVRGQKTANNGSKSVPKIASSTIPANDIGKTVEVKQPAYVRENAVNGRPVSLEMKLGNCSTTNLLIGTRLAFGSDSSCDIVFNEASVESVHAFLEVRGNDIFLVDNSRTGTYLEGMRISSHNRLESGDMISLGNTEFIIRF